ncbi:transmembrane protease serine 9-like [Cydia amplana]|uniref:transmembrane protease serine 9-like n=1 Tax=Cydia amplana TaxID=1869771 RepID=UPI002FE51A5F
MITNLVLTFLLFVGKTAFSDVQRRKGVYFEYIPPKSVPGDEKRGVPALRMGSEESNEDDSNIKTMLEENYRFKSNPEATRFTIAAQNKEEETPTNNDGGMSWVFRTFAVRRIVGGMETSISMYPYNVAISRNGRHWCGGSIIDEQWVLTAGHCFESISMDPYNVAISRSSGCSRPDTALSRKCICLAPTICDMGTSISMYPYNVAISRNGRHWCGGSIIDEQWVLTAGHCFESAHDNEKMKLSTFIVRAGSSFHNRGGYQARVNKAFFPSKYVPGNADYDFSLVRLDRPMPIGRNIAVLNLPSKEYLIKPGDILIVTGWGSTHETGSGHIPDRLRFVPVPAMRLSQCQSAYRFYITPRMMCAGYATGGKDACNHDSGGPAVRDGVLLGIVSFGGKQCGDPHSPGVYSRVSELTSWVENTIADNECANVPELQEKIKRAKEREQDLQRFKARVEDKKNRIKNWLRETLKSPSFIELAKRKLSEAQAMRRSFTESLFESQNETELDDSAMDDINLSNLIHDRILQSNDGNEDDNMLSTLALRDIMLNEGKGKTAKDGFEELMAFVSRDDPSPPAQEKENVTQENVTQENVTQENVTQENVTQENFTQANVTQS